MDGLPGEGIGAPVPYIGKKHQVLCNVTHLPQIAMAGLTHFEIKNLLENGCDWTKIQKLTEKDEVDELAKTLRRS